MVQYHLFLKGKKYQHESRIIELHFEMVKRIIKYSLFSK